MKIEFELSKESKEIIEYAFSDKNNHDEIAIKLSQIITEDFIQLLGGKKRYLSLSHQYIDWIEKLYFEILPEEDFSYERLINNFYFPPGQAAYISRVLKGRQNVNIQVKSKKSLLDKLKKQIDEFNKLNEDEKKVNKNRLLLLTEREFQILDTAVARLIIQEILVSKHEIEYKLAKEGYKVKFLINSIQILHEKLNN